MIFKSSILILKKHKQVPKASLLRMDINYSKMTSKQSSRLWRYLTGWIKTALDLYRRKSLPPYQTVDTSKSHSKR
ncbi:hypothetical protein ACHAXN_005884 [Cyclotella atomus]